MAWQKHFWIVARDGDIDKALCYFAPLPALHKTKLDATDMRSRRITNVKERGDWHIVKVWITTKQALEGEDG